MSVDGTLTFGRIEIRSRERSGRALGGDPAPSSSARRRMSSSLSSPAPAQVSARGGHRGEFLDLSNLAYALTGCHWTLAAALAAFTGVGLKSTRRNRPDHPRCDRPLSRQRTRRRLTPQDAPRPFRSPPPGPP